MEELDSFYGAILKTDPRDYKIGSTSIEIPKAFNTETFEYNQLEYSKEFGSNLCTLYAPIGMLSDLVGKQIIERELLCKLRTQMKDFDPSLGGYLVEGNNCVRHWWNTSNPFNQIRQFAITKDECIEALEKGHRVNIGYRGNKVFNTDASDGVLDSVDIGKTTYGHSTTCKKIGDEYIVDSYLGVKKFNKYKISDFNAFLDSEITFPTFYLFLFANDAIDAEIQILKDKHKDSGVIFNEDKIKEYREILDKRNLNV